MFNFKNIAAAAAIATATLCTVDAVAALGAKANTRCTTLAGYDVCYIDNGNYGADKIGVFLPNGQNVAFMSVICTGGGGNRWEGDRNTSFISYGDMKALADTWCANY